MRGADCLQFRLLEGMERGMLGETVQHIFSKKKAFTGTGEYEQK